MVPGDQRTLGCDRFRGPTVTHDRLLSLPPKNVVPSHQNLISWNIILYPATNTVQISRGFPASCAYLYCVSHEGIIAQMGQPSSVFLSLLTQEANDFTIILLVVWTALVAMMQLALPTIKIKIF